LVGLTHGRTCLPDPKDFFLPALARSDPIGGSSVETPTTIRVMLAHALGLGADRLGDLLEGIDGQTFR
jgi:hypothetical protein